MATTNNLLPSLDLQGCEADNERTAHCKRSGLGCHGVAVVPLDRSLLLQRVSARRCVFAAVVDAVPTRVKVAVKTRLHEMHGHSAASAAQFLFSSAAMHVGSWRRWC